MQPNDKMPKGPRNLAYLIGWHIAQMIRAYFDKGD